MNNLKKWPISTCQKKKKVADCKTAERLVLWAIRLWSGGQRQNTNVYNYILEGFRQHGTVQGATNLLLLMDMMVAGLGRNFEINCNCYSFVGADEQQIFRLLAMCQDRLDADIDAELAGFLTPAARRICAPLFHNLADALSTSSLLLSREWINPRKTKSQFDIDESDTTLIH